MASILRDSSFGQLMQLCYGWNVAPYEDEKPDFELHRVISPEEQTPEESKNTSERNAKDRFEASSMHSRYEEVDNTVNVLHFGPNDPDDPQQWSLAKKTLFYIQICLLTFAGKMAGRSIRLDPQIDFYSLQWLGNYFAC